MPHEVIMPALGMAQDSGLIVDWLKAPGEAVVAGDALMEVETDKATMEVEAAHDGWLTDVRAGAGEAVPVGQVVALISETAGAEGSGAGVQATRDGGLPDGRQVIMPALGMAQDSGVIVAWLKAPGEAVAEGDALLEVETDKATMEVAADASGWLAAVLAAEGEAVPVGQVIAVIARARPEARMVRTADAGTPPPSVPQASGAAGAVPPDAPDPAARPVASAPVRPATGARVLASPLARRLAAERGLDLSRLAAAGIAPPYHAADLDRPELRAPETGPGVAVGTGAAAQRLEAEVPAEGIDAFAAWLITEGADGQGGILPALAAGAWRAVQVESPGAGNGSLILRVECPGMRPCLAVDPDLVAGQEGEGAALALILRDLTGSRITLARLGPDPAAPVLNVARRDDTLLPSLDFTTDQIDADRALSFLAGFAARLEDPLRQLL